MKVQLPPTRRTSAFTLIEVLVVIAIIAILASLILAISGNVQETAGRKRAESEIAAVSAALEKYKLEYGTYPEGDGGDNSTKEMLKALLNENGRPFIEQLKAFEITDASNGSYYNNNRLIDPFGNPYHYEFPGDENRSGTNFFDLWSQGRKNSDNEETWIKNW